MRHIRPILAALLLLVPVTPAAAASPLRWRPCEDDRTAQCATLRVPVDESSSAAIGVAVARRPAARPDLRIGVLLVNPGGPGGSGVDMALNAASFFSSQIRARFDIVGFDPRGVGRSAPVVCSQQLVDSAPSPLVRDAAGYARLVAYHRGLTRDCRKRTGPVYGHVDTISVARDMDRLRAALGEKTISFYGASYGTLLGAQYAERYPTRVRALALDSVMDHSLDTAAFLADGTAAAQDGFDWFVKWCSRDRSCVLHGRDVAALWTSLLARAARTGVPDPYHPGETLDVYDLLGVAFSSFYDPQWYSLAYFIDAASGAGAGRRAVAQTPYSFPAVFCADWKLPVDGFPDWYRKLAGVRAAQMPVSPLAASGVVACLGRWSRPDNPQRPLKPATVPTLLLGSRHDPATPYVWAQRAAAQLGPNATLATYNGWGHVSYGRSGCVTGVVDRYLIGLARPAPGTACPGVIPDQFGVG